VTLRTNCDSLIELHCALGGESMSLWLLWVGGCFCSHSVCKPEPRAQTETVLDPGVTHFTATYTGCQLWVATASMSLQIGATHKPHGMHA